MIKHITFLLICFFNINSISLSQGDGISIGKNYRIYSSAVNQSEVFIVKHPANPDILFSSANTVLIQPSFFISEGIYVSTNSGNSWYGSDTCNGANINFHGGDPSITIDKNGTFILTRKSATTFPGVYSHYSTNNGRNWSSQKTIATDDLERASIISDSNPASNFYGRTYAIWAMLTPPYPIKFTFTDDITSNWAVPNKLNNPSFRGAGGDIKLGPNSEVYVCWAGLTSTSPFTEVLVGFASSTNGGTNWNVYEKAFDMNGIVGLLTSKQNIRVNGLPRMSVDLSNKSSNGTIYIVTAEKNLLPAGNDPDIILRKSTDGGLNWSAGIRVNQDAFNNGKTQFFPAINVDQYGGINIIFYDDRNTTNDSSGVFLARSTDGGNNWNEYQISDHNFRPSAIGGLGQGYIGDNIDITSSGNKLYPVWMDNSSGNYQIWTAPIIFPVVSIDDEIIKPIEFVLEQNYPNPFNPSTKIRYSIPAAVETHRDASLQMVTLKIYDILGSEVATLVNEAQAPGYYEIDFNAAQLASGVYIYRLQYDKNVSVKKMIKLN